MADLTIDQGADFFQRFQVKDTLGNIPDLTNYTGKSEIRDAAGGTLIGTFVVIMGTTDGYVDLVLDDNDTNLLTPGTYVYDIFITNATTDDVQRIVAGAVTVSARITQ